jgi:hypothetical protein
MEIVFMCHTVSQALQTVNPGSAAGDQGRYTPSVPERHQALELFDTCSSPVRIALNETEFLPAIPALSWIRVGASTRLTWYTNYPGFGLEFRPNLDPGVPWAPVSGAPLAIDCENFHTISTNPPGIYRLQRPNQGGIVMSSTVPSPRDRVCCR